MTKEKNRKKITKNRTVNRMYSTQLWSRNILLCSWLSPYLGPGSRGPMSAGSCVAPINDQREHCVHLGAQKPGHQVKNQETTRKNPWTKYQLILFYFPKHTSIDGWHKTLKILKSPFLVIDIIEKCPQTVTMTIHDMKHSTLTSNQDNRDQNVNRAKMWLTVCRSRRHTFQHSFN